MMPKTEEPSPGFKNLFRAGLRAARAGLSAGFAVISSDLAWMLVPRQHAWWACGVVGGTMVVVWGCSRRMRRGAIEWTFIGWNEMWP
jgi:hypothetical protein